MEALWLAAPCPVFGQDPLKGYRMWGPILVFLTKRKVVPLLLFAEEGLGRNIPR